MTPIFTVERDLHTKVDSFECFTVVGFAPRIEGLVVLAEPVGTGRLLDIDSALNVEVLGDVIDRFQLLLLGRLTIAAEDMEIDFLLLVLGVLSHEFRIRDEQVPVIVTRSQHQNE